MRRFISTFLAITMLTALIPMNTFAKETNGEKISITASTEESIDVAEASTASEIPDLDTGLFTSSYYSLYIERDYEQYRTIELQNNTALDKEIYLVCGETPSDLAIDFIKGGSKSEPVLLKAGETKEVELAIFAQNATHEYNEFNIYAYEIGKDGDTASSKAKVHLNINIPTLNISTNLVSEDSKTLAKTYRITNRDDNIVTDLTVSVDNDLKEFAYFDTYIENYSLGIGESVEFTVKPDLKKMKEKSLSTIEGSIVYSGLGQTRKYPVEFDTNGKDIISNSMFNIALEKENNPLMNMEMDTNSLTIDESSYINSNSMNIISEYNIKHGKEQENTFKVTQTQKVERITDTNIAENYVSTEQLPDGYRIRLRTSITEEEYNQIAQNGEVQLSSAKNISEINAIALASTSTISKDKSNLGDEIGGNVGEFSLDIAIDISDVTLPGYDAYQIFELFKDATEIYGQWLFVEYVPGISAETKNAFKTLAVMEVILTIAEQGTDLAAKYMPMDPAAKLVCVAIKYAAKFANTHISAYRAELFNQIKDYAFNKGYKYNFNTNGKQCTNRGLISTDIYVPDYIEQEESEPEEPQYPQLESATVDVPSGIVEPGTVVTITPPEKGKVYYSLDNGEFVEYIEPLVINDSVSVRTRTSDDSEPPTYSDSEIKEYDYAIDGQPFAPKSEPASGVVEKGDTVVLTAEEGEKIYYAIDDNLEDEEFPEEYIEYTEPIEITKDCKIRTYVAKEGAKKSRTAELMYEVAIEAPVLLSSTIQKSSPFSAKVSNDTTSKVKMFYTGRMFGGGYVNSAETNYKYLLNGKEVATGTNTGLTEVNIAEIPTDGLKLGRINNFVRDYDTNPGSHSVSTDNQFTLIYPSNSVMCYVGDSSSLPDVRLRPDFAVYNENIYCGNDLIIGQKNKIKINYYNRGSQSGFYNINLYVNGNLVDSKENQFMKYFSSGNIEFDFTPTEANNNIKVEIVNTTVALDEETSANNIAENNFTARTPEVPSIDALSPNTDTEQVQQLSLSATITQNRDVKSVVFSIDDKIVDSDIKNSGTNYWVYTDTLEIGSHKVAVKVTDMLGNEYTKEQEFNIIAPIERYENYEFYYMQSQIYVKPNAEFDLNELVGVCDDEWENFEELKDYADNITVEFDTESGLTQKENEKFIFTATETGRFYITLKLGVNETDVSIYVSELDMQSCTYNFKYEDAMYPNIDVYHKDEYGWSDFWNCERMYGENGKSTQISIYPDDFTNAEDYKIFIKDNNRFMVEDFINGSVDVTGNDSATLSIKSNKDISDVSCTVYYLFDEDNRINAGYISENDEGKLNNLSLEKGKYQLRLSFSYGDDYYSGIQKEVDLTTETSAEIDLLSLLNYAVVDLTAINPSEDVEIYAVDEYGTTFINQVKISDNSYNVVLDDDMVENVASYKLFIVDGNKFYFAPLSTDTMVVELPETNNLEFTKADNITINDVKINSIDNIDYSVQLSYEDNTAISLPKNKYNIGVQFKVDDVDVYQEYDVDLSENNATVDLNQVASKINFVISWPEIYDNNGYLNLYSNNSRIATNYKNNSGTTLDVGNYDWTLNLSRGNTRYSISNNSEIVNDNQTKVNIGTTFVGTLKAQSDTTGYKANKQIAFSIENVKDEYGNKLVSCSGRNQLNAKIIYTNAYDENDIYEIPLTISSINTNSLLYATLPNKAGKYNAQLIIEGEQVNAPIASVESGTYKNSVSVKLTSDNDEATIYYTTDGSEPTQESNKYTGAITINNTCVLKAIAIVGSDISPVATYEYTITKSSNGGGGITRYTVTISYVDENGSEVATTKVSNRYGSVITEKDLTLPDGYIIAEESFSHKIIRNEIISIKVKSVNSKHEDDWQNPFIDVQESDWFYNAVKLTNIMGITNGVSETEFAPYDKVTRGQFITMLCRAYGIAEMTGDNFDDCGNTWYTGYLAAAKQMGISNGVGDNKFAPENEITREEMVTLIYNYLKSINEVSNNNQGISFADKDVISDWATSAVAFASAEGFINGKNNNIFDPKGKAIRAELAQIFFNIFAK